MYKRNTNLEIKMNDIEANEKHELVSSMSKFKYLIIDCSPFIFIDSVGVKTIKKVIKILLINKIILVILNYKKS